MKVLVDTCIWSLALRRRKKPPAEERIISRLEELIEELRVVLVGPVRQEVLSGIRNESQFTKVQNRLRAFEDLPLAACKPLHLGLLTRSLGSCG